MSEQNEPVAGSQRSGPQPAEGGRRYRLENPRFVRALIMIAVPLLLALLLIDFFAPHKAHFPEAQITIDTWPGFFPAYDLLSSLLLVLIAKVFGLLLKRKDDYYQRADVPTPEDER